MRLTFRNTVRTILFIVVPLGFWFGINEAIKPGYTYNVWINIDELANALLYGDNETISARLGRYELEGSWLAGTFCDVLDVFFKEEDHCILSLPEGEQ